MRAAAPAFLLVLLLGAGCNRRPAPDAREKAPAPASATAPTGQPAVPPRGPPMDRSALLRGELPAGAELDLLNGRCQICHTLEYVTQQRLSEVQWDKTLTKMQKWGSPLTDDERKQLAPFLAATWKKDLPDRESPRVPTPPGALPVARAGAR